MADRWAKAAPTAGMTMLAMLIACAPAEAPVGYPSLAPRPAERPRVIADAPPAAEPAPPELGARLAEAARLLEATARRLAPFEAELDRRLARARGARWGSEPWIEAQLAWSRLVDARAQLAEAAARAAPLALEVEPLAPDAPERSALDRLEADRRLVVERVEARLATARAALGPR